MVSLFVKPITFDSKQNLILQSTIDIEWKKQIGTVAIKKGSSPEEYLKTKIIPKITSKNSKNTSNAVLFGSFNYYDNKKIYLVYLYKSLKTNTDLTYNSNVPEKKYIKLYSDVIEHCNWVVKHDSHFRIKGEVYAICMDDQTYYLEDIDINHYIKFIQRGGFNKNKDVVTDNTASDQDEDTSELEYDDYSDGDCDGKCSGSDSDSNSDKNEEDNEEENEKDNDLDNLGEEDVGEGDDAEECEDTDVGEAEGDDAEDCEDSDVGEDAEEDVEEAEPEQEEDNDGDGLEGLDSIDDIDDIDDIEEEETVNTAKKGKASNKKKDNSKSKNSKSSANLDLSIILNILKPEDKAVTTPDTKLHEKRLVNLKILKKLPLSDKIVRSIEKSIYNYAIDKCKNRSSIPLWDNSDFVEIYISKSKNLYTNLNKNCYVKNTYLLDNITNGKIDPFELAFLDTYKLFPEKWTDIIEEKAKIEKILKEALIESASTLFECPRCHKNKTIYCEVQTRSSDEPMTKFITCLSCGLKWKKY